jgi:thiosulfate/3-mercaptopyruvate sulfurtransferase
MRFRLSIAVAASLVLSAQAQSPRPELLVSPADLARAFANPDLVVLHIADGESSYTEGHVPGARFVRYGDFAINGDTGVGSELPPADQLQRVFEAAGVSDTSRVVLYGPSTVMTARAFFTLDAAGLARVALLDGGLAAWKAEKRPLETGAAPTAKRGTFTPKINASKTADAAFIQQQLARSGIALVDVRPDAEYRGSDGGMGGMHPAGHIAGAQQMPWNTLVGQDGRFRPRTELEAMLRAAGATAGKPVVSYCLVGMRASVVYFVARYLGHDARLYDGSIVDWGQRKLPTVRSQN